MIAWSRHLSMLNTSNRRFSNMRYQLCLVKHASAAVQCAFGLRCLRFDRPVVAPIHVWWPIKRTEVISFRLHMHCAKAIRFYGRWPQDKTYICIYSIKSFVVHSISEIYSRYAHICLGRMHACTSLAAFVYCHFEHRAQKKMEEIDWICISNQLDRRAYHSCWVSSNTDAKYCIRRWMNANAFRRPVDLFDFRMFSYEFVGE